MLFERGRRGQTWHPQSETLTESVDDGKANPPKTGSLVCPTAKTAQMFIGHLDAHAPHWVDRLSRDSSQLGELQIEIRDQFRRFAEQMTLSVLSEAALPGADLERREKTTTR